jgi:hypothetical protein
MSVDRAAIERSWKERGFSCGLWVDPPGQVWSDYVHDTDELIMIVEGSSSASCSSTRSSYLARFRLKKAETAGVASLTPLRLDGTAKPSPPLRCQDHEHFYRDYDWKTPPPFEREQP